MTEIRKVCQPVTALFDISRDQVDGRTIDMYLEWLLKTISIFPDVLVFHDGTCDRISDLNSNFVKVDREILFESSLIENLKQIFVEMKIEALDDITFKTPTYSIVQFLKFQLLRESLYLRPALSYMWVDAGISRFIKPLSNPSALEHNSLSALKLGFKYIFEIDLKQNLDFTNLSVKKALPGTCKRIISGTSFWIDGQQVDAFNTIVDLKKREWQKLRIWDNDQVLLRNLATFLENVLYIRQGRNSTGSVARFLLNESAKFNTHQNLAINWLIRRDQT